MRAESQLEGVHDVAPPPCTQLKRLTACAAALAALTLPLDAQAQDLPTAEQCNDRRLLTLEKFLVGGDGTLTEGQLITGRNLFQVHRAPGCNGIDRSLLNEVLFCVNIWDTTPCEGAFCRPLSTKIQGGVVMATFTTDSVCAILAAGSPNQGYLVAATNDNAVRDDPKNRFIVALKVNPRQHVVFDIRDDD